MMILKGKVRKILRDIVIYFRKKKAKKLNIETFEPNLYVSKLNSSSIMVDCGCGYNADFSIYMIEKYNLRSFGIDPTRKHAEPLKLLSEKTNGRFQHVPVAITSKNGTIVFNESAENVSGSIHKNHINVKNDTISTYEVETITPETLFKRLGQTHIDFLKLDLEGAEYGVIANSDIKTFDTCDQVFIEFHHHCIDHYSKKDTRNAVKSMAALGFKVFTIDNINYIFYR